MEIAKTNHQRFKRAGRRVPRRSRRLCSSGFDYDGASGCADLDCAPRCAAGGDSACGPLEDHGKLTLGRWLTDDLRVVATFAYAARTRPDGVRAGLWATIYRFAIGVEHSRVGSDLDVTTIALGIDVLRNHDR